MERHWSGVQDWLGELLVERGVERDRDPEPFRFWSVHGRSVTPQRDHRSMDQQVRLPLGEEKAPPAPLPRRKRPKARPWQVDDRTRRAARKGLEDARRALETARRPADAA